MGEYKDAVDQIEFERLKQENLNLKNEIEKANYQAERAAISRKLQTAALAEGVIPGATDGVIDSIFRDHDVRLLSNGEVARYRNDRPDIDLKGNYTLKVLFDDLKQVQSFFFQSPQNTNGPGGAGNGEMNPWRPESWNVTQQGRVLSQSRAEAERMAKEANSPLFATHHPEKK